MAIVDIQSALFAKFSDGCPCPMRAKVKAAYACDARSGFHCRAFPTSDLAPEGSPSLADSEDSQAEDDPYPFAY